MKTTLLVSVVFVFLQDLSIPIWLIGQKVCVKTLITLDIY